MAVQIVQNSREGDDPIVPALRESGEFFPFGIYYEGGRSIAWADSFAELVDVLSPGYLQIEDEQARLVARIRVAMTARRNVQAEVFVNAKDDDVEALSDGQRALIDGTQPGQPVAESWDSEIPLVLITTAYQPHTEVPAPVSKHGPYLEVPNMLWIDPLEDDSLIRTLHEVGYVRAVETSPEMGLAQEG